MEVSVCSRFFIDSLLSLSRPEAPESRPPSSSLPRPRAPVSRPESTLLPAHLRSRTAASSFFIRDILADRRNCSLRGQAGRPEPQTERLQSGPGRDLRNKSPSNESGGEKVRKIKAFKQLNWTKTFSIFILRPLMISTGRKNSFISIRKGRH